MLYIPMVKTGLKTPAGTGRVMATATIKNYTQAHTHTGLILVPWAYCPKLHSIHDQGLTKKFQFTCPFGLVG